MFDPTVFDNLKVVLEGTVYDLDLKGAIRITNRSDRVELSTMSRSYSIRFELKEWERASAEICLDADAGDLAAEILELKDGSPGCMLQIHFYTTIEQIEEDCFRIKQKLKPIWGENPKMAQHVTFTFDEQPRTFRNKISFTFERKINESQIEDIPNLLEHMVQSLQELVES